MSRVNLRTAGISALFACLLIAVSAAPAFASWGFHKAIGLPEDTLSPVGVAVDEAGNIYASRFFNVGIAKFNIGDEVVPPSPFGPGFGSGLAVNPVSRNLYVVNAEAQTVEAYNPTTGLLQHAFPIPGTGNLFGAFTDVQIAADAHGNVYVPDAPGNKIEVFNEEGNAPEGGVVSEITGSGAEALKGPEGVAVGPGGNVWVADTGAGRIEEFEPNGTFLREIGSPHVQAVAVDSSGDVFAAIGGEGIEPEVIEYSAVGVSLGSFGKGVLTGEFGSVNGIAVDSTHEIVYVTSLGSGQLERFVSWGVTTESPSNVAEGQATLNGTVEVEPGSSVSTCKFEYGLNTTYGSSVPCAQGGPYTANTPVSSATLSGLTVGVDYHYRISATNAGGFTQVGEDRVFGPPAIDSESAEAIVTTARLRARLTVVEAGESSCKAQYVVEAEYAVSGFTHAHSLPCITPIGSTPGEYDVETEEIQGLQSDTVYHYRFITESHAGTQIGPDKEFATFGIVPGSFSFAALGEAQEPFTQAGGHPSQVTNTFRLNTSTKQGRFATDANTKNIVTELPPGLIGNPDATPKCLPYNVAHADCSGATQVGTIVLYTWGESAGENVVFKPIYNLVPPKGLAAQFAARDNGFVTVHIDARVRAGGDYGATAEVIDASADEGLVAAEVTLWGVPAAASHDPVRNCPAPGGAPNEVGPCSERGPLTPFLRNPTACTGEREARMTVEPWQQDEPPVLVPASAKMPAITGCGKLKFEPGLEAQPTTSVADSPTGLRINVHVPQPEGCTEEGGKVACELAESDLKDATVTFPAGMAVNPSSADGREACTEKQAGFTGFKELDPGSQPGVETAQFTPGPAECPNGAKLGTVIIHTPLIEHPIEGGLYLATPHQNPFGSLVAVYLAVYDPVSGVVIKLPGEVSLNKETGQVSTTFDQTPQLPFTNLEVDLLGANEAPGKSRASLTTPLTCGAYSATSVLAPWSGNPAATPSSRPFPVSEGCVGQESEASNRPAFEAGTASPIGGSYSPFVLKLSREDGSQRFGALNVTLPPGLIGKVAGIEQCPQADIEKAQSRGHEGEGASEQNSPSCPSGSELGTVHVGTGSGAPFYVTGRAYFAGPYEGAPFSLVIVTPAIAGPFDLGVVVVRAGLYINPSTAQVTVKSDPFPTILDGIPLDIRSVGVEMNRSDFVLNPTSCAVMSVTGEEKSTTGNIAGLSTRFQAGGCTGLPFHPSFTASTQGSTSRANGASLVVKIAEPANSLGHQANIRSVKVDLPKQLVSRLATLSKACLDSVFDQNPAACPAASSVGTAKATTPLLPVPLEGPAYFVSHGGAKFPELIVVLQGYGVTVDLNGETFINKAGITSSTFAAVPDVPVGTFELNLPEASNSALAANGKLCQAGRTVLVSKRVKVRSGGHVRTVTRRVRKRTGGIVMPTAFTAQNGAVIHQNTPVSVIGCPPTRPHTRPKAGARKGAVKRRGR
jgi:NHL repeat